MYSWIKEAQINFEKGSEALDAVLVQKLLIMKNNVTEFCQDLGDGSFRDLSSALLFPIIWVLRAGLEMLPVSVYIFKLGKLFQFFRRGVRVRVRVSVRVRG